MDFFTCCILVQENPLRDPSTPNAMAWTQLPGSCWNGFGGFLSSFLVCLCLVPCIRSLGLVKLAFLGLPKFLATSTFDGQPYKLLIFTVAQTRATNIEQWCHRVFTYIINREGRSQQISVSCKVLVVLRKADSIHIHPSKRDKDQEPCFWFPLEVVCFEWLQ